MKRADLAEVREVVADRKRRLTVTGGRPTPSHDQWARWERQHRVTELLEMMAAELEERRTP